MSTTDVAVQVLEDWLARDTDLPPGIGNSVRAVLDAIAGREIA